MVYSPNGSGNYKDLDKTRVKLFPNFTRHLLITHTYFLATPMTILTSHHNRSTFSLKNVNQNLYRNNGEYNN